MTHFEIAGLYIALCVLVMLGLKLAAGSSRLKVRVSIGDGGDDRLIRAMRAQANAVEDMPILLFGLVALAGLSANPILLHVLGGTIVVSRVLHALGMYKVIGFGRMVGTILSALALLGTPIALLIQIFVLA